MTENVFYPLFLTGALVLVLVLERPTWGRQLALLALIGLLFATRAQAVAFGPAIVVAPFLLALFGRQPLRATLVRFRVLYGLLVGGAIARARGAARARPVAVGSARRLLDRRRPFVRRRRPSPASSSTTWPSSTSISASSRSRRSCCSP